MLAGVLRHRCQVISWLRWCGLGLPPPPTGRGGRRAHEGCRCCLPAHRRAWLLCGHRCCLLPAASPCCCCRNLPFRVSAGALWLLGQRCCCQGVRLLPMRRGAAELQLQLASRTPLVPRRALRLPLLPLACRPLLLLLLLARVRLPLPAPHAQPGGGCSPCQEEEQRNQQERHEPAQGAGGGAGAARMETRGRCGGAPAGDRFRCTAATGGAPAAGQPRASTANPASPPLPYHAGRAMFSSTPVDTPSSRPGQMGRARSQSTRGRPGSRGCCRVME